MKLEHHPSVVQLVDLALMEDLQFGDITSEMLIPEDAIGSAYLIAKQSCVLAGQPVAALVFSRINPAISYKMLLPDGSVLSDMTKFASISGPLRGILAGERLALNFLQRLSGIATSTARIVDTCKHTRCSVADTRKTTPGLRFLEKYAVKQGGGTNHRMNLSDGILIKDNHIRAAGNIRNAVESALRKRRHALKIQIEVTSEAEAAEAVACGADALLLDNMTPDMILSLVHAYSGRVFLEASGNISIENARRYAETGVDLISLGSLTHSFRSVDISLEIE